MTETLSGTPSLHVRGHGMTEEILNKANGANFHLTDLHIHTPIDKRFKSPPRTDPSTVDGKKRIAEAYIEAARKRNIKILAITEHNDVSWVDAIREVARGTDILVFPGIELSADSGSGGIHVVALFEPDADSKELNECITELGLPTKHRFHDDGSPQLSKKPLSELVDFITSKGGICIAAHVLRSRGILDEDSMTGQPRIQAWKNQKLLAVEVATARAQLTGFAKGVIDNTHTTTKRTRPIAAIYSSDARSVEEIGSRATWIKISSKTLEGLKQAFLDWESRIRHLDELSTQRFSKILSAEWQGGFLDGLGIHFNDNLNCLIGGKGTGKSTILETIRFALGDEFCPTAEKAAEQHHEILKEVFKRGSKVRLIVEAHDPTPKRYIIERTYNDPPVVKDENGSLIPELKPADILSIETYGQKEIYEISKNPAFQLKLVDRFLGDKLHKLMDSEKETQVPINGNTTELLRLKQEVERLNEQIQRLPKLEEQLARYKQSGMPQKIEEKSRYEKENLLIQRVKEALGKTKANLTKLKTSLTIIDPLPDASEINELPNKSLFLELKDVVKSVNKAMQECVTTLEQSINSGEASVTGKAGVEKRWKVKYQEQEQRYRELGTELKKQFPGIDIDNFIAVEREINHLKPLKTTRAMKLKELEDVQRQRRVLLNRLHENRIEQFTIRDRTCKEINKRLEGILRVAVEYEGAREAFLARLEEFRSGARGLNSVVESNNFSVPAFLESVRKGPQEIVNLFGLTEASAAKLCGAIKEEQFLELESFKVDTKTTIELNIGTKENPKYQNTKNLSIGQKCTAILTLILLESSNPLLIDQPEDDIDQRFIFNDIVQKLRKEKERRQFIIATHNANIPVLGDAELICVLSADAEHGYLEEGHYGSIDDKNLKKPVEEILEGGREAFQLRRDKYGF